MGGTATGADLGGSLCEQQVDTGQWGQGDVTSSTVRKNNPGEAGGTVSL